MISHHDLACHCTPEQAWNKVEVYTALALAGNNVALRILAFHVEHALVLSLTESTND